MHKLFLLRHAEAPSAFDLPDKERPLSDHGIAQAKLVSEHIKDIDLVLCSSALRTQMTCKAVIEGGATLSDIEYLDEFYNAPASDLLSALQSQSAENILIIAHNPGIHSLAITLMGDGNASNIEQLSLFYHPATLSVFECDIENWSDVQPNKNKLINLVIPE